MFLIVLLLLPCFSLFSSIVEVTTLAPIAAALENACENDLVIFDIDCTLTVPNDKVLRPCGEPFFVKQFETYGSAMPEEQICFLISTMLLNRSVCLVDEGMPVLVNSLQERGTKVIALTALFTGSFGAITSVEDWRIKELAKMGFCFSKAFPRYNHIVFGDIRRHHSLPIFKDGILFSSQHSKGEVLEAFLRRVKWHPKKVFFIDDVYSHIESIHRAVENLGAECFCFHYRAVENCGDKLNEEIARKQFLHLQKNEEWLSDAETLSLLAEINKEWDQ